MNHHKHGAAARGNGNGNAAVTLAPADLYAASEHFNARTERVDSPTGHIRWVGSIHPSGWPRLTLNGKGWSAARVAWLLAHGFLPAHSRVYRTCDEPSCVNHLALLNPRKKPPQPPRPPVKKLSARKVRNLRRARANGVPITKLARRLGVNVGTISRAVRGETWKWVA